MFTFSLIGNCAQKGHIEMYKGPESFIPNHFCFLECSWDGGDCCGDDVNTQFCSACQCLDPNSQKVDETCSDNWTAAKCANKKKAGKCEKFWVKKNCQKTCEYC